MEAVTGNQGPRERQVLTGLDGCRRYGLAQRNPTNTLDLSGCAFG